MNILCILGFHKLSKWSRRMGAPSVHRYCQRRGCLKKEIVLFKKRNENPKGQYVNNHMQKLQAKNSYINLW